MSRGVGARYRRQGRCQGQRPEHRGLGDGKKLSYPGGRSVRGPGPGPVSGGKKGFKRHLDNTGEPLKD